MINIERCNEIVLELVSYYLNNHECAIDNKQIKSVMDCGVDELEAYTLLLQNYLEVDNREIQNLYFKEMVTNLNKYDFVNNPYYKNISFHNIKSGKWELKYSSYKPYELFVQDDFKYKFDGRVIPNLGYFNDTFQFPAVYENDRLWMSVTPNEINTMIEPINNAKGKVVTFGLGLGYFAYMCSLKDNVEKVVIVEKDEDVIRLFKENILSQFEFKSKIEIVQSDAYEFLSNMTEDICDYVFVDIYHDASDGVKVYQKFKPFEVKLKNIKFDYWIEKTIRYYV